MIAVSFLLPAFVTSLATPLAPPPPHFDLGLVAAYEAVAHPPAPAPRALWNQPDLTGPAAQPQRFDEPGFGHRIALDLVDLGRAPFHLDGHQWRRFGLGLALVGTAALFDDEINERSDALRDDLGVRAGRAIRPLGQEGGLALLGAAWLAGRGLDRPGMVAFAKDGIEATILTALVVGPLKEVVGRTRPRDTGSVQSFSPFSGELSFPSGEAAQAFALAAVAAAHTDQRWLQVGAYGLAGLVALARIELDGHWASDVVAGALIGHTLGRFVAQRHAGERLDREARVHWRVTPTFDREHHAWGIGGALSF